jgi:hypothetical protein
VAVPRAREGLLSDLAGLSVPQALNLLGSLPESRDIAHITLKCPCTSLPVFNPSLSAISVPASLRVFNSTSSIIRLRGNTQQ